MCVSSHKCVHNCSIPGQEPQRPWHCQGQRRYYVNMSYRSHDSLSLMHHANAAGSRPTMARSPVPLQSMHSSPAALRQPLTKLDINQQQQQQPQQTKSADSPAAGGQADVGCPVSMSTEQHQCHQQQQQQTQEWDMQSDEDAEATHSHGLRDAPGTATVRRLDKKLQLMQKQQGSFQRDSNLQGYQQTAGSQHRLPVEAKDVLRDMPEPRQVNSASYFAVISPRSASIHAEDSHSLAHMLESTGGCMSDIQMPTAASRMTGRREDEVVLGVTLTKPGCSAMKNVQHAGRHHERESSCKADNHAAHYHQQWQQQQQQNDLQVDLPAGIPLTPMPGQMAQPRDSLEASIWKLSSSQGKQQTPPNNVFGPPEQNMPPEGASGMYRLQPNQQKPNTRDKSLHMMRDGLAATLQKLAARQ